LPGRKNGLLLKENMLFFLIFQQKKKGKESVFLSWVFHFSRRWQQHFSKEILWQRSSSKMLYLDIVHLRMFTKLGFLLPGFSCGFVSFLFGKV
jgi:hypothetical protein